MSGTPLDAPTLLCVEVASAVGRATGDLRLVARAIEQIRADFQLHPLAEEQALSAASVAAICGVRGADAVYLALAQELKQTLVSLDEQQIERGAKLVPTQRP